jgi:5'-deoxynucleotidase YfbR-like HD superfamily hydrolase
VNIVDIAHALSMICRFTGHTEEHYSVAQHSLIMSEMLPQNLKLQGLLHDAHEAYVGDVSAPLKRCAGMQAYRDIEDRAWKAVAIAFDLPCQLDAKVKEADLRMVVTEKEMLGKEPKSWEINVQPYPILINPMPAAEAEQLFLRVFRRLTK